VPEPGSNVIDVALMSAPRSGPWTLPVVVSASYRGRQGCDLSVEKRLS